MKTVVTILQLLCGLAIILIVLFQSGKSRPVRCHRRRG